MRGGGGGGGAENPLPPTFCESQLRAGVISASELIWKFWHWPIPLSCAVLRRNKSQAAEPPSIQVSQWAMRWPSLLGARWNASFGVISLPDFKSKIFFPANAVSKASARWTRILESDIYQLPLGLALNSSPAGGAMLEHFVQGELGHGGGFSGLSL